MAIQRDLQESASLGFNLWATADLCTLFCSFRVTVSISRLCEPKQGEDDRQNDFGYRARNGVAFLVLVLPFLGNLTLLQGGTSFEGTLKYAEETISTVDDYKGVLNF